MVPKCNWYVLHVQTGKELDILKRLESRGIKAVVPQAVVPLENRVIRKGGKWINQEYVVFTGYVFIYMNYDWAKYYALSGIPGIINILGGGKSPTPLTAEETKFIIYLSEMLAEPSVVRFTDNDNYEIVSGFLADYKDNIVKIKRRNKKATVSVVVAGEKKEFTVSFVEDTSQAQTPEQTEG